MTSGNAFKQGNLEERQAGQVRGDLQFAVQQARGVTRIEQIPQKMADLRGLRIDLGKANDDNQLRQKSLQFNAARALAGPGVMS
ncbi:hypothetical protein, partial [Enterococcus casseliflavus]|uniref:hypothetical protein n=1 Tax=Enterococcus casseliflavus TaxID=37734 RepID=UPI003D0A3009